MNPFENWLVLGLIIAITCTLGTLFFIATTTNNNDNERQYYYELEHMVVRTNLITLIINICIMVAIIAYFTY